MTRQGTLLSISGRSTSYSSAKGDALSALLPPSRDCTMSFWEKLTMCHRAENGLCAPSGGLWRCLPDARDGEAPDRCAPPRARPVNDDVGHCAARSHANPKAGELGVPDSELAHPWLQPVNNALGDSQTDHSFPSPNTNDLRGKHRGNTVNEPRGTPRKQGNRGKSHFKLFSDSQGNARKLNELDSLRMAFKRSGVRLPLAPPITLLECVSFLCAVRRSHA